jgi:hypothetical protein
MQDFDDFFDLSKEPNEIPTEFFNGLPPTMGKVYHDSVYTTRIMLIVFDPQESEFELNGFSEVARQTAIRENVRFGILTDHRVIRKLK